VPLRDCVDQFPAARYASSTLALMRPRGETSTLLLLAQARIAAGSPAVKLRLHVHNVEQPRTTA